MKINQWLLLLLIMLAACTAESTPSGPRLISEVTVAPTDLSPTRFLSPTPRRITPEVVSPLDNVTVDAQFVVVTPTLPPSKTPTPTPTVTPTPTTSPTPTMTNTATATGFLLPTSEIIPVTDAVAAPNQNICDSNWFFIEPRPEGCPLYPPNSSPGVYQEFENGFMIWVGSQDAIYVMYNDLAQPRWQVFRDFFNEGMSESDPNFEISPGPTVWQPRRGFGLLWRDNQLVRTRIGWATQQWEQPYSVQAQTGDSGTIFLSTPGAYVFGLFPGSVSWNRYIAQGNTLPGLSPTRIPARVPLPTVRPPGS